MQPTLLPATLLLHSTVHELDVDLSTTTFLHTNYFA
jgi:hypothetical protein